MNNESKLRKRIEELEKKFDDDTCTLMSTETIRWVYVVVYFLWIIIYKLFYYE